VLPSIGENMKLQVENVVNMLIEKAPLAPTAINLINQSAVFICMGNMEQAKGKLDQVMEVLELKS